MRQFLLFIVIVGVALFVIGEWRGLYLGLLGQTPVVAYKTDHSASSVRRTISSPLLPFNLSGDVRAGTVTVRVTFERPASFQSGAAGSAASTVFEETYRSGDRIELDERIEEGIGVYTVTLDFEQATGLFRLRLPAGAQL